METTADTPQLHCQTEKKFSTIKYYFLILSLKLAMYFVCDERGWSAYRRIAPKIMYPIVICCSTISEVDVGLVSLFNGTSTFCRLCNAKAILLEEQQWYYLTHSWEDKGVHTFPNCVCLKVNVIARLEYELAHYDSAVRHFNHTPREHPPP